MQRDITAAVERLYQVFGAIPLDPRVDYCDHCVSPDEVEALSRTPLRRLTSEQLGRLLVKGVWTWGDVTCFKHFLPRLLELIAAGEMEDHSYSSYLPGRLALCWDESTREERDAIGGFLDAWWLTTVSSWPSPCQARDVLETISDAGRQTHRCLKAWSTVESVAAARHLAEFVRGWVFSVPTDDQFWIDVDRWLSQPAQHAMLMAAARRATDPAVLADLTGAAETLAFYLAHRESR